MRCPICGSNVFVLEDFEGINLRCRDCSFPIDGGTMSRVIGKEVKVWVENEVLEI